MSRITATVNASAFNLRDTIINAPMQMNVNLIRRIYDPYLLLREARQVLDKVNINIFDTDPLDTKFLPKRPFRSYRIKHADTEKTDTESPSPHLQRNNSSNTPSRSLSLTAPTCSKDGASGGSSSPPEPPSRKGMTTVLNENQVLVDRLVNAAEWGHTTPVINILTQHGISLLKAHHSNTGNTALHAAITHNQLDVVGAIIQAITIAKVKGIDLVSLLTAENHVKETPLQRLPDNPVMRHELLAGLSCLWPFCHVHKHFTDKLVRLECGCRVCDLCIPANIKDAPKCSQCRQTLGEGYWEPDTRLSETRAHIDSYASLFVDAGLNPCTHCQRFPAFPPYIAECGHTFCQDCLSPAGDTCPGFMDSNLACQRPLKDCIHDIDAAGRFVRLFSSTSPYLQGLSEKPQLSTDCKMTPAKTPNNTYIGASASLSMPSSGLTGLSAATSAKENGRYEKRPPGVKDATIADNRHYKSYRTLDSDRIDYIEQLEYRILTGDKAQEKIPEKLDSALRRARIQQQEEREREQGSEAGLLRRRLFLQAPVSKGKLALLDPTQDSITLGGIPFNYLTRTTSSSTVGIAQSIGKRKDKRMEDRYIAETFTIKVLGETVQIDITGVFDGNGKPDFAEYAANNIIRYIIQRLEEFIHKYGFTDCAVREAFKIACVDTSRTCHRTLCGTTVNIALFIKGTLWIVNVGDSRALWVDKYGEVTQLSEDARPNIERFKKSIEKRDGKVTFTQERGFRVNNRLAPARCFGVHELNGAVSARPTIVKIDLNGISGYLVQVTDGLTDVASTHTLGNQSYLYYVEKDPAALMAEKLNIKAFFSGSLDNLTTVVTDLDKYSGKAKTVGNV